MVILKGLHHLAALELDDVPVGGLRSLGHRQFHLSVLSYLNAIEHNEFYAVTTIKHRIERNEANCLRDRIFYDQQTETEYEVETAAIPYEEAVWLTQLYTSRYVALHIGAGNYKQILITDENLANHPHGEFLLTTHSNFSLLFCQI